MAAALTAAASCPIATLPQSLLRTILAALPVDARARACAVCRAWRDVLADATLWQVLDLSPSGGVAAERVTPTLHRFASGAHQQCLA